MSSIRLCFLSYGHRAGTCVDLGVERWVIISMMVACNDVVVIEYDGRRLGLPNAPVVMEHANNRTEESTAIALIIQHNPYART